MKRLSALALSVLLLVGLAAPAQANAPGVGLTVLFTHDTHDRFYPDAGDRGGYTRLATLLEEQRRLLTERREDIQRSLDRLSTKIEYYDQILLEKEQKICAAGSGR